MTTINTATPVAAQAENAPKEHCINLWRRELDLCLYNLWVESEAEAVRLLQPHHRDELLELIDHNEGDMNLSNEMREDIEDYHLAQTWVNGAWIKADLIEPPQFTDAEVNADLIEPPEFTDAQVIAKYSELHDGLSDMIERGRLLAGDIPDDYRWLVDTLAALAGMNPTSRTPSTPGMENTR